MDDIETLCISVSSLSACILREQFVLKFLVMQCSHIGSPLDGITSDASGSKATVLGYVADTLALPAPAPGKLLALNRTPLTLLISALTLLIS